MGNKINELMHRLHSGLSVAENGGDVADYLPELFELEALIAAAKDDPSLLADFDAGGIEAGYRAEGYVWCECEGDWLDRDDMTCDCAAGQEVVEREEPPAPALPDLIPMDGPPDVDWMGWIADPLTSAMLAPKIAAFGGDDPLLWAWRWIARIGLSWGDAPRHLEYRLTRPPILPGDRVFWAELPGIFEGIECPDVKVADPLLWAECARLLELDAREQGEADLVELAQEMGREVAALYKGAGAYERALSWRAEPVDYRAASNAFGAHFRAGVRRLFGRYHEWMRQDAYGGWTNRIGDLGNDAEWGVSLVSWYTPEIGSWQLIARLLAQRALRLAREFCDEHREQMEALEMDEFDLAPQLFGVGIEDSLRRTLCATVVW